MNRRNSLWGLLLVAAVFFGGCGMEIPEQVLLEGMTAMKKEGNYIYAQVQFDKFLTKYPDHENVPQALLGKAQCHFALREPQEALEACDEVLVRCPGTDLAIQAAILKSQILDSQGEPDAAVAVLTDLREQFNRIPQIYQGASMNIGEIYFRNKKWQKAAAAYRAMIDSASINAAVKPSFYLFLGSSLASDNQTDKALQAFNELQTNYPESNESIWSRVEIARLYKDDKPDESQALLDEAIDLYQQMAATIQDATEVVSASPGLKTEGFMGAQQQSAPSPADQQRIFVAMQISRAYLYVEQFDKAIEVLEELKNRYLSDAVLFQVVTNQVDAIRRQQELKENEVAASKKEVSAATAAVGSVSP